jgi:hypothetical protein
LRKVVFYLRNYDVAYANETNITETVTAETATEAATEQASIYDESHQYTDLTSYTREVGATYETIQLK